MHDYFGKPALHFGVAFQVGERCAVKSAIARPARIAPDCVANVGLSNMFHNSTGRDHLGENVW